MGWFGIFGESAEERNKRKAHRLEKSMANKVWKENGVWPSMSVKESGLALIYPLTSIDNRNMPLDHPSTHGLLGRYAVVDHWIARLSKEVSSKMEEDRPIIERWARLDYKPFWQELARIFDEQEKDPMNQETALTGAWEAPWSIILEVAGFCGSLAPFEVCPKEQLTRYLPWAGTIHPRVGLFLESQGVCSMEYLRTLVNPNTMPMYRESNRSFAGSHSGEPLEAGFVAQWCAVFLKEYGLSVEQKVRLVAQTIYSFGHDKWMEHMQSACAPYLQDVDLTLVYAVCNVNTAAADSPEFNLLQTVKRISGQPAWSYAAQDAMNALDVSRVSAHTGLMMLCEFTPPQDRLELYSLAKQALHMDRQLVQVVDTLELPALG